MAENRLIDAVGLRRRIIAFATGLHSEVLPVDTVMMLLIQIPTVDAVEVVRCKDCIRRYDTDECPMCHLSEGKYYEYTNGNGYCDRGERKDNELVERKI